VKKLGVQNFQLRHRAFLFITRSNWPFHLCLCGHVFIIPNSVF